MPIGVAGYHHPLVRAAKALQQKKHRRLERCFLVEGPNAVAAALDAGSRLRHVFFTRDPLLDATSALADRATAMGIDVFEVDARTLGALAQTGSPQGVVAVADFIDRPIGELKAIAPETTSAIALVLHDLADPGNAGTLIRSAEAFGAGAVCFGSNAVDPYNDKVVRASAGALFRVAIYSYGTWPEFAAAAREARLLLVAAEAGAPDVMQLTARNRIGLILGHERHGLRDVPASDIDARAGIPQSTKSDSLNAGVAGSILLYEISRLTGVMGLHSREHQPEKSQAL